MQGTPIPTIPGKKPGKRLLRSRAPGEPAPAPELLLRTAADAARAAGCALLRRFRTRLEISEKPGEGLVTNADLESERVAIRSLKRRFPEFGILTEESAGGPGLCPGRWIIDPLDGTANFAHGLPTFCVSIAAEWKGKVVAGAIFHPVSGELYTAIRGKGAFVGRLRLRVSSVREISNAFLSTGFSSRKEKWLSDELLAFERLSRAANGVRRPGSAALDLAGVARGAYDGFWERGLAPWDIAAGMLLVEEAGGRVSDFDGKPLRLEAGQVVASNNRLHGALIGELQRASCRRAPQTVGTERTNVSGARGYNDDAV